MEQVGAWPRAEAEPMGQEIQNPTQHIPQANKRANVQTCLGWERRNQTLWPIVAENSCVAAEAAKCGEPGTRSSRGCRLLSAAETKLGVGGWSLGPMLAKEH